ncbi:hypothetical protein LZ31DRAFT_241758 [Colletotrichum somersetense]|nr:hypothetical protein LZ31DRAFT_241758 [Colletotrichum somersetense]
MMSRLSPAHQFPKSGVGSARPPNGRSYSGFTIRLPESLAAGYRIATHRGPSPRYPDSRCRRSSSDDPVADNLRDTRMPSGSLVDPDQRSSSSRAEHAFTCRRALGAATTARQPDRDRRRQRRPRRENGAMSKSTPRSGSRPTSLACPLRLAALPGFASAPGMCNKVRDEAAPRISLSSSGACAWGGPYYLTCR